MPENTEPEKDIYTCPIEWPSQSILCKPHRCDLPEGHEGQHICNCGSTRQNRGRYKWPDD